MNKQQAHRAFNNHDKESAFLGYSKSQSDRWLDEIQNGMIERDFQELNLF